ncbi:MAG: DNA repair protein RecN [Rickettsiales bacterium]|nr:DNA repair protein RecN [Rickettsiales bacterium]
MLTALQINNLTLIKSISLDFSNSLNIITGETGSGKSVLLDCISFTLGTKNNRIITSDDKGFISLSFDISENEKVKNLLKEAEIEPENDIIIRRNIGNKSQIFINETPVSQNFVRNIAEFLVESYRQNDFTGLLNSKNHIEILDNYSNLNSKKSNLENIFREIKQVKKEIETLEKSAEEREKERDFLKHAIKEIENFSPENNEEEQLVEKRKFLSNKKKILEILSSANNQLEELNIAKNLLQIQKSITKLSGLVADEKINLINETLENSIVQTDRAAILISEINDEISGQENNLDEIEERLFSLRELARKYNVLCDELPNLIDIYSENLANLENSNNNLSELKNREKDLLEKYFSLAEEISEKRKSSANKLETLVNQEFPVLNMKGAKFLVDITSEKEKISAEGIDNIIFKVATNPGQTPQELGKVASGGEISRVMLALKIALSGIKSSACLIFDEIDTGIGGATADLMGDRIKKLSENQQVLCITHQPQIAGKASNHIFVFKKTSTNKTEISAKILDKKETTEEIARMISGVDITKEARAVAVKLKK